MKWLNNISIRTQILATTILFVLLCCACAYVGYWGQAQVREGSRRYDEFSQVAAKALEIDRDVQEYKFRSDNFVYSGSQVHLDEANLLHQQLTSGIKELEGWSEEGELPKILENMQLHLATVGHQLNVAKEERGLRHQLVNRALPYSEQQIDAAFAACNIEAKNGSTSKYLAESQLAFENASKKTLKYFISPSTATAFEINNAIRTSISTLEQVTESNPQLDALRELLADHQRLCNRAVTATRSYLYYANVVLAGEVSEFLHYSSRLRDFIRRERNQSHVALQNTISGSQTRSLSLTGVAVFLSILLAGLFCKQILEPISKLTATFRELANDRTSNEIPCLDLNNEIGKMANAASVFNAKNIETRKLLERSEKLGEELRVTNQELDNFAYVASHDLRSPLRGISNLAQWVQEDCMDVINEDSKRNLKLMEKRVEVMDKLLSDLLEYSRIGRVAPEIEPIDCQHLVEEIFGMVENESLVDLRIAQPLPSIQSVKTPLMQVLLNLITNAIKYNDKGQDGWVEVDFTNRDGVLEFSVSDNGIGIDPKHFHRIFQMYQRVSKLKKQGSGMGLALVKKNVENCGGSITVESELGSGSIFRFTWPVQQDHAFPAPLSNSQEIEGKEQCLTSC